MPSEAEPPAEGGPDDDGAFITLDLLSKKRKGELQDELQRRGLSTKGNKPELLERMKKAISDKVSIQAKVTEEVAQQTVFNEHTRWKVIKPIKVYSWEKNKPTTKCIGSSRNMRRYSPPSIVL